MSVTFMASATASNPTRRARSITAWRLGIKTNPSPATSRALYRRETSNRLACARGERPVAGVAAEVEHAPASQRASARVQQPLEEIAVALTLTVDQSRVRHRRRDPPGELEAIMPSGERGDPLA